MSIVLQGSTSGSITLQEPAIAGSTVLSLPATTGTVLTSASPSSDLPSSIKGPAFSATLASNQNITSGTFTKVQCGTEEFDTANCYDNTTNYRFTPNVAGYYQVSGRMSSTVSSTLLILSIYKNGAEAKRGTDYRISSSANTAGTVAALIYLNGSTDYVEFYGYITGTSPGFEGGSMTYFQAFLARAA